MLPTYITNFPAANGRSMRRGTTALADAPQFGNGARLDFQNDSISSRTRARRASNVCIRRSIIAGSPPYHSGGTDSAICHSVSAGNCSTALSHGSKLAHPVTRAYTWLRAKTPRSGESGNVHSPALKQNPWSMKIAR
jgi:hypothetical protein